MLVVQDGEHPRLEIGPGLKAVGGSERADDGILHQIVDQIPPAAKDASKRTKVGQTRHELLVKVLARSSNRSSVICGYVLHIGLLKVLF
jgi:hypothetical protein